MTTASGLGLDSDAHMPLLQEQGRSYSRGELHASAATLAQRLIDAGAGRILIQSDSARDLLVALDAASRAGADLFVAHTTVSSSVIKSILADNSIVAIFRNGSVEEVQPGPTIGRGNIYLMTSGTTGVPKLVSHTLETLLARLRKAAQLSGSGGGGRWLLTYQPTGFAGIQVQLTAALTHGVLVVPSQRTPAGFRQAALEHGVTEISATPTFWRSFLMTMRTGELELRQVTLGGEATDQATLDRLRKVFPEARITHTYASTEAGVVYAVHDGLAGFPAAWLDNPERATQIRVRDGMLQIRSPNTMRGYLSAESQPLTSDGWLVTADRVEQQGDRVVVIGREDATINVAGSKVYPLEVEQVLLALPGIAEARVYGVGNALSGALVAADIVLSLGADEAEVRKSLLQACRDQLAPYKRPRIIKFVAAIATAESGKKI